MVTRIPCLGSNRHWGRREVLHLLQMEVQTLGDDRQLCHVFLRASRMATDEVRDDLLAKVQFIVDLVEYLLEIVELGERWLAHDVQYTVARVFRGNLQPATDVLGYQLAGIFLGATVDGRVFALVQEQVVTHTATNETLLDARQGIYRMIDIE